MNDVSRPLPRRCPNCNTLAIPRDGLCRTCGHQEPPIEDND